MAPASEGEARRTLKNSGWNEIGGAVRAPALWKQTQAQNDARSRIAKNGEIRRKTPSGTPHALDSYP